MNQDPLQLMKIDKWDEILKEFEKIYPEGITGYNVVQTQMKWIKEGVDYGFKVYCPFGEARNGIFAVINEQAIYEVLIECPTEDTSKMEEALTKTEQINWNRPLHVLFPPFYVVDCIKRVASHIGKEISNVTILSFYLLDKPLPDFDLPPGFEFRPLPKEYIELVDTKWPHRYPGSTTYFNLLLRANCGYGLFKDQELVSFGFVKETGALGHVYTLEEHRKKGYGDIVLKMLCSILLKEGRRVNSYIVKGNYPSLRMHEKLGFKFVCEVAALYVK